jgi:hypothetical protein
MLILEEIRAEIEQLAAIIGASGYVMPTYGRSEDFARPHIEVDDRGYHYVVIERGEELERLTTTSLDDLLYRVFEAVTFSLACAYESQHRIRGEDNRKQLFRVQLELLARLNAEWSARCSRRIAEILKAHPFRDH